MPLNRIKLYGLYAAPPVCASIVCLLLWFLCALIESNRTRHNMAHARAPDTIDTSTRPESRWRADGASHTPTTVTLFPTRDTPVVMHAISSSLSHRRHGIKPLASKRTPSWRVACMLSRRAPSGALGHVCEEVVDADHGGLRAEPKIGVARLHGDELLERLSTPARARATWGRSVPQRLPRRLASRARTADGPKASPRPTLAVGACRGLQHT